MWKRPMPLITIPALLAAVVLLLISDHYRPTKVAAHGDVLEGTWTYSSVPAPGSSDPAVKALLTFVPDGGMVQSSALPNESLGHGEWTKTGPRSFLWNLHRYLYNERGEVVGTLKVREVVDLNITDDGFKGRNRADYFDVSGKLMRFTVGTSQGERIAIESLE